MTVQNRFSSYDCAVIVTRSNLIESSSLSDPRERNIRIYAIMVHRELELTKNLLAQRVLLGNSLTIMPSIISLLITDGYIKLI